MSTYVKLGDDDPVLLASGGGFTKLADWMNATGNKVLQEFVDEGEASDTLSLRNELAQALDEFSNRLDPDTLEVAENLLENIGVGDPDEAITIVD